LLDRIGETTVVVEAARHFEQIAAAIVGSAGALGRMKASPPIFESTAAPTVVPPLRFSRSPDP